MEGQGQGEHGQQGSAKVRSGGNGVAGGRMEPERKDFWDSFGDASGPGTATAETKPKPKPKSSSIGTAAVKKGETMNGHTSSVAASTLPTTSGASLGTGAGAGAGGIGSMSGQLQGAAGRGKDEGWDEW